MGLKHRKRQWFDEEKRLISFQMTDAGVSLAQVAANEEAEPALNR